MLKTLTFNNDPKTAEEVHPPGCSGRFEHAVEAYLELVGLSDSI